MAKKLKVYNGSSWEDVTFAITPPSTNVTNSFTTNQVIDASTSVAALRITQRGSGEAFRVEDETNPDSTPFIINATGNVGIGTASPTAKLDIIGASGGTALRLTDNVNSTLSIKTEAPGNLLTYETGGTASQRFVTNGVERLRITSDGNVGVGINNPIFRLQTYNDLATSVGSQSLAFQSQSFNGNQDFLKLYQERENSTNSWGGAAWILRRHVDATPMGGIKWAPSEWNPIAIYGAPNDRSIRTTYISTGTPSGGSDGDMWATYV
jgi:hypothetical protein